MTAFQYLVMTLTHLAVETVRQMHEWGDAAVRLVIE
jgi:hypothetical protein